MTLEVPEDVKTSAKKLGQALRELITPTRRELYIKINNEGGRCFEVGNYQLAEHFYAAAFSMGPHEPSIAANLMNSIFEQGQYERALAFAHEQCDVLSQSAFGLESYGNLLHKADKYEEGLKIYLQAQQAEDHTPSAGFYLGLGVCLLRTENYREGFEAFCKANEMDENAAYFEMMTICAWGAEEFSLREALMLEELVIKEESAITLSRRRYLVAEFYKTWFCYLEDNMQLDPESDKLAKQAIYNARKYAAQAGDFAQMDSDGEEGHDLDQANQLIAEIDILIKKTETGFEPPALEV